MMAALTPELQLRPATAEDYEGVVAISDGLYVGVDYLQYTYHAWLKDPQRKMFVAKSEGKVVAFASFLVVDDGETAVLQAIRVAPWMRRSGVARTIHKFTLDNLRSDYPNVTRIRLTSMENPIPNTMISHRIIHCKAVVSVFLSANELEEAFRILESRIPIACKESLPPVFLDYSEVHGLFSGSLKEEDLVPERFLIQSWLPITICKANLDLLQRGGVKWLCSYPCDVMRRVNGSSGSSGVTGNSDNISVSGTGPSTSTFKGFVSLGTPVLLQSVDNGKLCLDIDMYGTDLSCAKNHVLLQLKEAVKALPTGGSIICCLYADESLRDGLTGLFDGFTPFHWCRKLLVLEMHSKL